MQKLGALFASLQEKAQQIEQDLVSAHERAQAAEQKLAAAEDKNKAQLAELLQQHIAGVQGRQQAVLEQQLAKAEQRLAITQGRQQEPQQQVEQQP